MSDNKVKIGNLIFDDIESKSAKRSKSLISLLFNIDVQFVICSVFLAYETKAFSYKLFRYELLSILSHSMMQRKIKEK